MGGEGGHCFVCCDECTRKPGEIHIDCVTIGSPCQPFTSFRTNKTRKPPEQHEHFNVTFVDFIVYLKRHKPSGGFLEQVRGFFTTFTETDENGEVISTSYGLKMLKELAKLGYWACHIICNMSDWIDVDRERHNVFFV